jgi:multidrug efflux pump subunit AcrA (membrane-fusion protein)
MMAGGGGGDSARAVEIPATDARRIGVTYTVVSADPVARELRVVGQVAVDETRQTSVSLKLDGWVERLWIDFTGRTVRRGEPMLALYAPMLVSAQEELLLAHRHARAMAASAGVDPEAARAAEGLVTSARRRLRLWDVPAAEIARLERTGEVRRTLTLAAPASGVVVEKNVVAGQQVQAGEPLFRLADLSTVWVEGEVFEQDLPVVRPGAGGRRGVPRAPGETWKGRVSYVYPTLDPATRTARVRIAMPNREGKLKPGMYATLRLEAPGRAGRGERAALGGALDRRAEHRLRQAPGREARPAPRRARRGERRAHRDPRRPHRRRHRRGLGDLPRGRGEQPRHDDGRDGRHAGDGHDRRP